MKLILTLFLMSILGQIQQLNGQCYDLIRQYNQCKHLKMEFKKIDYIKKEKYFVNYTANFDLTDRFYRKLMSKEMNFNKAMNLFRKIYTETDNCTSEFCKCVSLGVIDYHGNYSLYFRNKDVFPHVKRIIEDFNKKFESYLKPYSQLRYNEKLNSDQNLSSLAQFCIKYDYSYNRYGYYKMDIYGKNFRYEDLISEFGCFWEVLFERKTLDFKKLSNSDLGKLLKCQIKRSLLYSSTREEARFLVINAWATDFPNFVWEKNKNITEQIDSFITTDRNKTDLFLSAQTTLYSYANTIFIENTKKINFIKLDNETQKMYIYKVFDSPPLRIDCQWTLASYSLKNYGKLIWEWANFTFKFNDSTSRTFSANMSFDGDNHNPFEPEIDISNETLISDRIQITKISFIKREYFLIVDYKYNITVEISSNKLVVLFPPELQNQTSGLMMIDGLQNNNLIDRKKRSTDNVYPFEMSCQTMCEKNKKKFPVMDKMDSLLTSEIDFNYCLNDCFKQHLEKLK